MKPLPLVLLLVLGLPLSGQNSLGPQEKKTLVFSGLEAQGTMDKADARLISEILRSGLVEVKSFELLETSRQEALEVEKQFSGTGTGPKMPLKGVLETADYILLGSLQNLQGERIVLRLRLIDLKAGKAILAHELEFLKETFFPQIEAFRSQLYNDMITLAYGNNLESVETLARFKLYDEAWARLRLYLSVYPLSPRAQDLKAQIQAGLASQREGALRAALESQDDREFWDLVPIILAYDEQNALEEKILKSLEEWTLRDQKNFQARMDEIIQKAEKGLAREMEKTLVQELAGAPTSEQKTLLYETLAQVRLLCGSELRSLAYSYYYKDDPAQSAYYLGQSLEYNPEDPKSLELAALLADQKNRDNQAEVDQVAQGLPWDPAIRPLKDLRLGLAVLALDDPEVRLFWKGTFPAYGVEYQEKQALLPPIFTHWFVGAWGTGSSISKEIGGVTADTQIFWTQVSGGWGFTASLNAVEFQVQGGPTAGVSRAERLGAGDWKVYLGLTESAGFKVFFLQSFYLGLDFNWNQTWFFPAYGNSHFKAFISAGMTF